MAESVSYEKMLEEKGLLVYTNVGTSMLPLLRQNRDLMVIEKRPEKGLKKYDAVLYRSGKKYILHRILKVTDSGYVLCGDNCRRLEYGIRDKDILGVLKAVIRDGREISVTAFPYQLYVHLWCDFRHVRFAVIFCRDVFRTLKRRIKQKFRPSGEKDGCRFGKRSKNERVF